MTNAINAAATSERELTIDELDAVSGGGTNGGNVAGGWDLTTNYIIVRSRSPQILSKGRPHRSPRCQLSR